MRCARCYRGWDRTMQGKHDSAAGISRRLKKRLHWRYLRWLAIQPPDTFCRSARWRNSVRSYNRRMNQFVNLKLVRWLGGGLLVGAAICWAGLAIATFGVVCMALAMIFIAPPEHHPFINDAQRDAVALTRLTVYQTLAIALAVIYCTIRSHTPKELERHEFFNRRDGLRQLSWSIAIAGLILCVGSAVVLSGVSWQLPNRLVSIAASVLVAGSISWFAVALCRRAKGVRTPRLSAQATTFVPLGGLIMLVPLATILYRPVVLEMSVHLAWFGPLGRANAWLYELGNGRFASLLPLGTLCAVLAVGGYCLHRSAGRWSFRRRLLFMAIVVERDRAKRQSKVPETPAIARDLRDALSSRERWSWRSIVCPRWIQGSWATLLTIAIALLLTQALMIGLGLFLARLEAAYDAGTLPEKLLIFGLASSTAAWSVLSLEVVAACYRDTGKLFTFPVRPVSPWDVWVEIQRDGLAFVPTQILYAIPFVVILALFTRDYMVHGLASVGIALLTCIAIRTFLIAGTCVASVSANLRFWIRHLLEFIVMFGGMFILLGLIGQAVVVPIEGSLLSVVIRQLVLNAFVLFVLAVAAMAWHAGARPFRKSLR